MSPTERQLRMLREMGLPVWLPLQARRARQAGALQPVETPVALVAQDRVAMPPPSGPEPTRALAPPAAEGLSVRSRSPAPTVGREPAAPAVTVRPAGGAPVDGPPPTGRSPQEREAIARLDWEGLAQAVRGCTACGLCASRRHTVFGAGDRQAAWMIVGEAPGEQEDEQGEPFVGRAGQLLDRMLAALSLTRATDGPAPATQRVYIANTLKCRPPRNRNPAPEETAMCEPFLQRQIALLQPRLILAMGAFAARSLLRTDAPVGSLRGRVHRLGAVPLVVTYHPSYLLRQPGEKAKAWDDLCLAADVVEGLAG